MDLNFENKAKSELDRITLKAEKIEFALNDFKDFAKKIEKLNSDINKNVAFQLAQYEKLQKGVKIARNDALEVQSIVAQAKAQYNKDIKTAKDLGVDTGVFNKTMDLIEKLADRSQKDIQKLKNIKA